MDAGGTVAERMGQPSETRVLSDSRSTQDSRLKRNLAAIYPSLGASSNVSSLGRPQPLLCPDGKGPLRDLEALATVHFRPQGSDEDPDIQHE